MCRPNTANPPRSLTSKIGESFRLHVPALKVAHLPQQQSLSGTRLLASVCAAVTHVEIEKLRRLQVHSSLSALKAFVQERRRNMFFNVFNTPPTSQK